MATDSTDFGVLAGFSELFGDKFRRLRRVAEDFGVLAGYSELFGDKFHYLSSMFFIKDIIFPVANHKIIIFPVANHKMSKTSACFKVINVQNIENFGVLPKTLACLG